MSARLTISDDGDGTHSAVVTETTPGGLRVTRFVAGEFTVAPSDPDRRTADEMYLMSHDLDPSFASLPAFVQRVREENGDADA